MECGKVRERLSEALEGSLAPAVRAALAAHLETCAACRQEERLLIAVRDLLARHGVMRIPVDLTYLAERCAARDERVNRWTGERVRNLVARLTRSPVHPFTRSLPLRWGLTATAAVALLVGGVWQAGRDGRSPAARPAGLHVREVADAEELHQAFAVQQSLDERDGLLLFAPRWAERGP